MKHHSVKTVLHQIKTNNTRSFGLNKQKTVYGFDFATGLKLPKKSRVQFMKTIQATCRRFTRNTRVNFPWVRGRQCIELQEKKGHQVNIMLWRTPYFKFKLWITISIFFFFVTKKVVFMLCSWAKHFANHISLPSDVKGCRQIVSLKLSRREMLSDHH